ncbi:MAG TPA: hypothetical protein PKD90_08520 [Phnomibacter sp.]|nr:hypothetical protein [Phnomibacter sp.]
MRFLILIALLLSTQVPSPAQTTADSVKQKFESLEKENALLKKVKDSLLQVANKKSAPDSAAHNARHLRNTASASALGWSWLLVYFPALLSIGVFNYIMRWLKRENYKLSDAVSATPPAVPPPAGAANPPDNPAPAPNPTPSSSRLIAFLSGMAAIVLAICFTTYFAYFSLQGDTEGITAFKDLWPIIASMGIGVIPYAVNVWGGNAKEGK